jgi:hypothetical protein
MWLNAGKQGLRRSRSRNHEEEESEKQLHPLFLAAQERGSMRMESKPHGFSPQVGSRRCWEFRKPAAIFRK